MCQGSLCYFLQSNGALCTVRAGLLCCMMRSVYMQFAAACWVASACPLHALQVTIIAAEGMQAGTRQLLQGEGASNHSNGSNISLAGGPLGKQELMPDL